MTKLAETSTVKAASEMEKVAFAAPGADIPTPRSSVERTEPVRRKRLQLGSSKLGVDVSKLRDAGFYCHWINDQDGRVQEAMDRGYQFVSLDEIDYVPTIGAPSTTDGKVSRRVGTIDDKPLLAFLMKIRTEWKAEDDEVLAERCNQIDAQIKGGGIRQIADGAGYSPKADHTKLEAYTSRKR